MIQAGTTKLAGPLQAALCDISRKQSLDPAAQAEP